jgi:hypothetical protein
MEELPQITLKEITDIITNIISVCSEAYIIVREGSDTPEADLHWLLYYVGNLVSKSISNSIK